MLTASARNGRAPRSAAIGAFFSGIASLSLHGWLWIAFALAGSAIGVRWRPVLGYRIEL